MNKGIDSGTTAKGSFGSSFAPEHKKELLRVLVPLKLEWMKNRKDLQK